MAVGVDVVAGRAEGVDHRPGDARGDDVADAEVGGAQVVAADAERDQAGVGRQGVQLGVVDPDEGVVLGLREVGGLGGRAGDVAVGGAAEGGGDQVSVVVVRT
ncbi:hypothetical protein GCM10025734_24370 [Kitasatospora paranensis]